MTTDDNDDDSGAVYAPATFQFSNESGRVERILVGLFGQEGEMEVRRVPEDEETPDFYVPAMFQFSGEKGRIERFLDSVLEQRGGDEIRGVPEEFADDFYLPAADPDDYGREVEEPPGDLTPASEVKGDEEDDEE